MSEKLVTMIFEIDQEVYDQVVPLIESLGTTIEDMAAGFIKFSVIPENLPLLKAYLGIENALPKQVQGWNYIIGFSSKSSISQPRTRDNL